MTTNPAEALSDLPIAVDIDTATRLSAIGRTQLYAALREGRLPARKNGRHTVILVRDLEEFVERLPRWQPSAPTAEGS